MNNLSLGKKSNWKTYRLSQICSLRSGKTPSTKKKEYWCNHEEEKCDCINWYQGKDIIKEKLKTERRITQLAVEENKQPLTTDNSLLFFALECFPFYSGQAGASCYGGGPGVIIIEPRTDLIIPNYFYYWLLSRHKELKFLRSGSVQKFLTKTELQNFPLSLPPLPIQHQILSKFQLVYNKIHKTEVVYNDTLLKIIQKYLEIGDLLFLKYKDSEIKVGDEFKLVRGKTPSTKNKEYWENGTIKWINSGILTNCYFLTNLTLATNYITEKARKECKLKFAQVNSMLISHVNLDKSKMVWNRTTDYLLGDNILNFVSEKKLQNATLFFGMRITNFAPYSSLSVINHIRGFDLLNLKINWVSNPTIQARLLTLLNSPLAKIKDLLLLKYFSG